MDFDRLNMEGFLAKASGTPLRAKVLRALSPFQNGPVPVCAMCFSDRSELFAIFNHLPVPERWDHVRHTQIQGDIYETAVLAAPGDRYNEIETGKQFRFSANWDGGGQEIFPVKATELWAGLQVVHLEDAKVHTSRHKGEVYEFLLEMFFATTAAKWKLSQVPNFPMFFSLEEVAR